MNARCILDNQHGIQMTEADLARWEKAEEIARKRTPQYFGERGDARQAECETVLVYAKLKTEERKAAAEEAKKI